MYYHRYIVNIYCNTFVVEWNKTHTIMSSAIGPWIIYKYPSVGCVFQQLKLSLYYNTYHIYTTYLKLSLRWGSKYLKKSSLLFINYILRKMIKIDEEYIMQYTLFLVECIIACCENVIYWSKFNLFGKLMQYIRISLTEHLLSVLSLWPMVW